MAKYLVDNFSIRQWSSRSTEQGSSGVALTGIYLYEGNVRRGQVYFYPDTVELRPPVHRRDKHQILLSFNMSQLSGTLAMLERGPATLFYNSVTDAGITTVRVAPVVPVIGEAVSTEAD